MIRRFAILADSQIILFVFAMDVEGAYLEALRIKGRDFKFLLDDILPDDFSKA